MSDRYDESSGTPVVILRSSTINDVLSVMFGYFLKLEQKVLEAGRGEKKCNF